MFVCLQAKKGFTNLTGIDYSLASVELAKSVLREEGFADVNIEVSIKLKQFTIESIQAIPEDIYMKDVSQI